MSTSSPRPKCVIALRALAVLQSLAIVGIAIGFFTREAPQRTERALASREEVADERDDLRAGATREPASRAAAQSSPTIEGSKQRSTDAAFSAPSGSIVLVAVRDERGQVPDQASVALRLADSSEYLVHRYADQRGTASFAGLAPGAYELQATCSGHRDARVSFSCAEGQPPQRFELTLISAWILGVRFETKDGRAHHELWREWWKREPQLREVMLSAIATRWEPQRDFPLTSTRDNFYGLSTWQSFATMARPELTPEGCVGYLELEEREPLWVSAALRHRVVAKQRVEPGQEVVVFAIDEAELFAELATLRFRVVDAVSGLAIQGAQVELKDSQGDGHDVQTDAEGRAELTHLRPGLLILSVAKGGASADRLQVRLEPGEGLDLGDLALRSTRRVQVRCEGLPAGAKDFYLWAIALDPTAHPALKHSSHRAIAAGGGNFAFSLPEGRYALRATGAGGARVEIDTRVLGDEPVVLRLAAEATFRIDARAKGEAIEMVIVDANARRVARYVLSYERSIEIQSLPGPYRIELTGRDGVTTVREVVLPPEGLNVQVP